MQITDLYDGINKEITLEYQNNKIKFYNKGNKYQWINTGIFG